MIFKGNDLYVDCEQPKGICFTLIVFLKRRSTCSAFCKTGCMKSLSMSKTIKIPQQE